ncbi:MAG: glutamate--tRNA ligase [Candidatus Caldarchaeum sp.]|nr:glutamate--tRNA ligase [Candidatus Caldarchaeum sp.]
MTELRDKILLAALRNAVQHGGKAVVNSVMSKLFTEDVSLRQRAREIKELVTEVVDEVNRLSLDEQKTLLTQKFGESLGRPSPAEEPRKLPPLPNAEHGRVVTRLPPEPSGYMHVGHAIAGLINEYYARIYGGKLWLRFEDTNPRKVRKEYYESFRRGYRWLGIEWDYEKNNSDDMEKYYDYAKQLIEQGLLYACFCGPEAMHRQRAEGIPCPHRNVDSESSLEVWNEVINGKYLEGEVAFRLRGVCDSPNTALRDPVMFRIVDHPHPLTGREFRLWPTYDFAAAVQDGLCGVTHVLRSSEFAFRDELQNMIRGFLGLENPVYVEFARFEFKGVTTSKREIRSLIEDGLVSGWDDPRLTTMDAIKRRGLKPQTLREFMMIYAGVSYAKKEYDWSLLYSINRKLLDPVAKRLFFVVRPVRVKLQNFGGSKVELPFHPSADLGKRTIEIRDSVYIAGPDAEKLKVGDIFRCKLFANIKVVDGNSDGFIGEVISGPPIKDTPILQWVSEDHVPVKVLRYGSLFNDDGSLNRESLWVEEGYGERIVEQVAYDEVVQFERYGFVRRDSTDNLIFVYCHD